MNLSSLLPEIKKRRDLRNYYKTTFEFVGYLNATRDFRFKFRGMMTDNDDIEPITSQVEYIHRWTLPYVKGWLAKLYLLDDWYRALDDPPPVTLATLTTYQAGKYSMKHLGRSVSIPESFALQKWGWQTLHRQIRRDYGAFDYVSIIEPHLKNDTGYPHTHVPLFLEVDECHQEKYREMWEKKYKIGSEDHGLDFAVADQGSTIKSLRNYIAKYLSKGFLAIGSRFGDEPITPGHLVFHAIAWKNHYRLFGASQDLSQVMRWKPSRTSVDWLATSILEASGDERLIWMAEDREGSPPTKQIVSECFGVEFE